MTDKNRERNVHIQSLYNTDSHFKKVIDGLESSVKDYQEYYNSLSPEKKAVEIYFWQEFVSGLD